MDAQSGPHLVSGPRVGFWLYLLTDGAFEMRQGQSTVPTALEGRLTTALGAVPRGTAAAPLFINDRIDIAMIVGADGVHLPATGVPTKAARRLVGAHMSIGASTHTVA